MRLVATDISKRYGGTVALDRVSFDVQAGEVHALVGENGAGKSTLLKVLAAVEPRDSGAATLDGNVFAPRSLRQAEAAGVAHVFQELNVNRSVGIAENVFLGRLAEFRRFGLLNTRRLRSAAQTVLDELGADIAVDRDIDTLDLGQLKIVEVARALAIRPGIIFFDESTAFLNNREVRMLLAVIDRLRSQGIGIAFVSHHLNEVFEIADRLTVLKDGGLVGTYPAADIGEAKLHELMVGRGGGEGLFPTLGKGQAAATPVLEIKGLRIDGGVGPIDLSVGRGRIVGIGGLKGSGGDAVLSALTGMSRIAAGSIHLDGAPYRPAGPSAAWESGVAYLPGDRTGEGLIPEFAVDENLTLAVRPGRWGFADRRRHRQLSTTAIDTLRIKTPTNDTPCSSLSGGNMQKVVLGKCLAGHPRLLLLNNPTRGVDVGAKAEIYRVIRRLADDGIAVLMVSEDLPELIGLSDQVLITRKGDISQVFPEHDNPSEEEAVRWML